MSLACVVCGSEDAGELLQGRPGERMWYLCDHHFREAGLAWNQMCDREVGELAVELHRHRAPALRMGIAGR